LEVQRKERLPLQKQVDELAKEREETNRNKKEFTNEEKLKGLKQKLDSLPIWPHFADVYAAQQYNSTVLSAVTVAMNSVMDHRDDLEKNIAQQYYKDRTAVDEKKITADREKADGYIRHVTKVALENVHDPNHLLEFAQEVNRRKDSRIVLEIAEACYSRIQALEQTREERDKIDQQIAILVLEKEGLEKRKKELPKPLATELEQLQDHLKKQDYPTYLLTSDNHGSITDTIAQLTITSTFNTKRELNKKIADDHDLPQERKEFFTKLVNEIQERTIAMILKFVFNPTVLINLAGDLKRRHEWEASLKICDNCLVKLQELRKVREQRKEPEEKRKALLQEREELDKKRKQLSAQKNKELRQLELECRLFELTPSYFNPSMRYDNLCYDVVVEMVSICLDRKQEWLDKAAMSDDVEEEAKEAKKKEFDKDTSSVVNMGLKHIESIENLIRLAQELVAKKEYFCTITVGTKCEELIDKKAKELEEREKVKKHFQDLEAQRMQQLVKSAGSKEKKEEKKEGKDKKEKGKDKKEKGKDKKGKDKKRKRCQG